MAITQVWRNFWLVQWITEYGKGIKERYKTENGKKKKNDGEDSTAWMCLQSKISTGNPPFNQTNPCSFMTKRKEQKLEKLIKPI